MHEHVHPHQPSGSFSGPTIARRTVLRSGALGLGAMLLAACGSDAAPLSGTVSTAGDVSGTTATSGSTSVATETLAGFDAFAETVKTFADGDVWMVESNGIPTHQMMVGITSWQQQVPVAQPYMLDNAWQIPRSPQLADTPVSARTGLFRGAIALAVNGVPIFNALNNRGDDAFLVGELDELGGHCGRGDDYHYHVAPLHLQDVVGQASPIAYALDGFAIFGSVEPDGSSLEPLDEYNGHIGADGAYHYHGTTTYPYINGGLVGVVEVSDQVEPQPETPAFRPAGEPLAGATVSNFEVLGTGSYRLEYTLGGIVGSVDYTVTDVSVSFTFTSPTGVVTAETYTR